MMRIWLFLPSFFLLSAAPVSSFSPLAGWPARDQLSLFHTEAVFKRSFKQLKATKIPNEAGADPSTINLLHEFVNLVRESLPPESSTDTAPSIVSLTLRGPSKKTLRKHGDDATRGCLRLITGRLISLKKGKKSSFFLQVTFKYHLATDIVKNWPLKDVAKGLYAVLGLSGDSESATNLVPASEWGQSPGQRPGTQFGLQSLELSLIDSTVKLNTAFGDRKPHQLTFARKTIPLETNQHQHDRTKQVPIQSSASFLQALGVTNAQGKPRPGMASKLRQCQKFVEVCGKLIEGQVFDGSRDTINDISVVDMGCGRGYLTFALHNYISERFPNMSVRSRGIDVRPKLVEEISGIAQSLGGPFSSLRFEQGTIEDFLKEEDTREAETNVGSVDVLIALHACDTATDDALWSGISKNADVIVVAPCCHRQLRSQLDRHFSGHHPLADILRHKIYREREAETVTDSLRALLLEMAGYDTQVFEFIGGEHTSKNVMITAVKQRQALQDNRRAVRSRIQSLSQFYGIHEQKLAVFMSEKLSEGKVIDSRTKLVGMPTVREAD